jgi:hypothetical protein
MLLILGIIGCADKSKEAAKEQKAVVAKPEAPESASGSIGGDQGRVAGEFDPAAEEQAIAVINQVGGQWSTEPYSRMELFGALVAHGNIRDAEEQAPKTSPERKPVAMVNLLDSDVTDNDLESLKGLTGLQQLLIDNTQISDNGLEHVKDITSLRVLTLSNTAVTDDGLTHLAGLTDLSMLYLGGTKITDAGLVSLRGLSNLQVLNLGYTQIGDAGLEHLKGLTGLAMLDLRKTKVTDDGLAHLKSLTNLRELRLSSLVTDAGVNELKMALPKVRIPR